MGLHFQWRKISLTILFCFDRIKIIIFKKKSGNLRKILIINNFKMIKQAAAHGPHTAGGFDGRLMAYVRLNYLICPPNLGFFLILLLPF